MEWGNGLGRHSCRTLALHSSIAAQSNFGGRRAPRRKTRQCILETLDTIVASQIVLIETRRICAAIHPLTAKVPVTKIFGAVVQRAFQFMPVTGQRKFQYRGQPIQWVNSQTNKSPFKKLKGIMSMAKLDKPSVVFGTLP